MRSASFPALDMNRVPEILNTMSSWFGTRDATDDACAFVIELAESLYPTDLVIIDARHEAHDFHGADTKAAMTSLEREDPGPFQERDIATLLRRAFAGRAIFLNPMREDSGTELTDVLALTDEVILLVQAKDSPQHEGIPSTNLDRPQAVGDTHTHPQSRETASRRDRQSHGEVVLRTPEGPLTIPVGQRALRGLVVVREMFDDDYRECSTPVLVIAQECRVPCVLLDYSALHIIAFCTFPRRQCG